MRYVPTALNRIVNALPPSEARLPKTAAGRGLKSERPLWCFASPYFFVPVKMLCIFSYRAGKPSHTTGTLYAICPKFIKKVLTIRINAIL
jgi:hypothetical protein